MPTLQMKIGGMTLSMIKTMVISIRSTISTITKGNDDIEIDNDIATVFLTNEEADKISNGNYNISITAQNLYDEDVSGILKVIWVKRGSISRAYDGTGSDTGDFLPLTGGFLTGDLTLKPTSKDVSVPGIFFRDYDLEGISLTYSKNDNGLNLGVFTNEDGEIWNRTFFNFLKSGLKIRNELTDSMEYALTEGSFMSSGDLNDYIGSTRIIGFSYANSANWSNRPVSIQEDAIVLCYFNLQWYTTQIYIACGFPSGANYIYYRVINGNKESKIPWTLITNQTNGLQFAQDAEGNWGYIAPGADTVTPFKKDSSGGTPQEIVFPACNISQEFTYSSTNNFDVLRINNITFKWKKIKISGTLYGRVSNSSYTRTISALFGYYKKNDDGTRGAWTTVSLASLTTHTTSATALLFNDIEIDLENAYYVENDMNGSYNPVVRLSLNGTYAAGRILIRSLIGYIN